MGHRGIVVALPHWHTVALPPYLTCSSAHWHLTTLTPLPKNTNFREVPLYDLPPVYFVGIQMLMLNEQQFDWFGQI